MPCQIQYHEYDQYHILKFKSIDMNVLNYRISSISSQSPHHPASGLIDGKGWQSEQTKSSYPQQITLQFYVPIRSKSVKLTMHQYKIPQAIEIFVRLGAKQKYRKLGYIQPSDNTHSSHTQKELVTMFFQFQFTHLKLLLHAPYKNSYNIFEQVGLEGIVVIGEITYVGEAQISLDQSSSDDQRSQSIDKQKDTSIQNQRIDLLSTSSSLFKEIFSKLEGLKMESVKQEDFQTAAQYKAIINNFKQLQSQINSLQKQKKAALQQQDFDKCHKLKLQINRKKELVQFQIEEIFGNGNAANKYIGALSRVSQASRDGGQTNRVETGGNLAAFASPPHRIAHEQQIVPALLNKGKKTDQLQELPLETAEKPKLFNPQTPEINQSIIHEQLSAGDYSSIKKDINQIGGGIDQQFNKKQIQKSNANEGKPSKIEESSIQSNKLQTLKQSSNEQSQLSSVSKLNLPYFKDIQPLQLKIKARLQSYFQYLPQVVWRYAYSRNWKAKQSAIQYLQALLSSIQQQSRSLPKQNFIASFQFISKVLTTCSHPSTRICSLQSYKQLVQMGLQISFALQHLPYFVQQFMDELVSLLNDTNSKVRDLAYMSYLMLGQIKFIQLNAITMHLIKYKQMMKTEVKFAQIRLELMADVVESYAAGLDGSYKEIVNWAISYVLDPSQKIRHAAQKLMIMLATQFGSERLMKILETHKPEVLQVFHNLINQEESMAIENTSRRNRSMNANNSHLSNNNSKDKDNSRNPTYLKPPSAHNRSKQSVELSYSRESIFQPTEQSFQKFQQHQLPILKHQEEQEYRQEGRSSSRLQPSQDEIQVLAADGFCDYCDRQLTMNPKQHLKLECPVIAHCQLDDTYLYIRDFTRHLLEECQFKSLFQRCKKCGLAFPLDEINEHNARGCKARKGYNWERCQFCAQDVLDDDQQWLYHAQRCQSISSSRQMQ